MPHSVNGERATRGERPARLAYALLLAALAPAYAARLWWRGRAEPLYRVAIGERFGRYADAPSSGWVWVHAVSLGETRAAAALVDALRARRPDLKLLLTHGTATGREAGAALLRPGDRQTWLPYDAPPVVQRFLGHFRPAIGILMETEVWPNLVAAAHARGVPLVLANARLSERSARRGERLAPLLAAWQRHAAPRPLLVIVPRHPQRFDAVAALVRAAGLTLARRSEWTTAPPPEAREADVWLGDSMGEMAVWYGLAQVALLGGSWAPLGGQNLIEAAACGCPLVLGPHTFNFSDAAELAIAAEAAVRVADIVAGVDAAVALVFPARAAERLRRSQAALAFAGAHRGAAARMAARILDIADRRARLARGSAS